MRGGEERARYVEEVGSALADVGLPRMHGRVLGALLVANRLEVSAEELGQALRASAGTISTSTRALESLTLVERVRKAGDRKTYYRLRPGAWHELVRRRAEAFGTAMLVVEKGLRMVGGEKPEVAAGLRELLEFMCRLDGQYIEVLAASERGSKQAQPL